MTTFSVIVLLVSTLSAIALLVSSLKIHKSFSKLHEHMPVVHGRHPVEPGRENVGESLGLVSAVPSVETLDYRKEFFHAADLTILMNDGNQWIRNNLSWLRERIANSPQATTLLILAHPESPYVPILARKEQVPVSGLVSKIRRTEHIVRRELPGRADCIGHVLITAYSLVMSEDTAVFVPYLTSRAKGIVPALVFKREDHETFFDILKRDVDALKVDCRPIDEELDLFKDQVEVTGSYRWRAGTRLRLDGDE